MPAGEQCTDVSVVTALVTGGAGVVFGLALAAPPGPMNAVIAEESVLRGWRSGFFAGLGAMVADLCFLVLALLGAVTAVERVPALRAGMVGAGGLLMLYFAYGAAADAAGGVFQDADPDVTGDDRDPNATTLEGSPESHGFRKAFVLAITNPYQIIFWLTVGVGLLRPGRLDVFAQTPHVGDALAGALVVQTGSPALLVGLFGGIAVWITGFPAALVGVGRRVDRFATAVAYASAAVLAGFGVVFLIDALGTVGLV
jgi:Putative threonine efflux protein